jgi:hypothetical protein
VRGALETKIAASKAVLPLACRVLQATYASLVFIRSFRDP